VALQWSAKVGNYIEQWEKHKFCKEGIFDMGKVHALSFQAFSYT